nr:hypothetical protein [Cronobacter turicensis]
MPPSAHLFASLTADTLPSEVPFCIGSDAQMLSRYCKALNMALISRAHPPEMAETLTGLLFDLVNHLVEFVRERPVLCARRRAMKTGPGSTSCR